MLSILQPFELFSMINLCFFCGKKQNNYLLHYFLGYFKERQFNI